MKAPSLKSTKEYRLFLPDETNRSPRKTKKIMASMKQWGFLPAHSIACVSAGTKMRIRDGQHRFFCAKELGIPVYYICHEVYEGVPIPELNGATAGPWNPTDYIESFCNQGKVEYAKLRAFVEENKLPVMVAAGLLSGNVNITGGTLSEIVKGGKFTVRDVEHARKATRVITTARLKFKHAMNRNFVDAVSRALRVPGVTDHLLSEKVEKYPDMMRNAGTTEGYLEVLEDVFNFRNRERVPLRFLASEIIKARNPRAKAAAAQ